MRALIKVVRHTTGQWWRLLPQSSKNGFKAVAIFWIGVLLFLVSPSIMGHLFWAFVRGAGILLAVYCVSLLAYVVGALFLEMIIDEIKNHPRL